jgi:hypothetical protein
MLQPRKLLEERRHQLSRALRLDVRVVETPEVGETV